MRCDGFVWQCTPREIWVYVPLASVWSRLREGRRRRGRLLRISGLLHPLINRGAVVSSFLVVGTLNLVLGTQDPSIGYPGS